MSELPETSARETARTGSRRPTPRGPLDRLCALVHRAFEAAVVVLFAAIVLVAVWQVVNRFVIGSSLSWSEEFQRYGHIWLVFFAVPIGYRRGAHIGVDFLQQALSGRAARIMESTVDLAWLVLGAAIVASTSMLLAVAWRQTSPGLGVSMDKVYLGLVIGGAYLAFTALERVLRRLSGPAA